MHESSHDDCGCCADVHFGALLNQTSRLIRRALDARINAEVSGYVIELGTDGRQLKLQLDERGPATQQTDVVTLNAELLEVVTEGQRHIASVHFSGMLRESAGAPAVPFSEVWHLVKPIDDSRGWAVAGIQQLN